MRAQSSQEFLSMLPLLFILFLVFVAIYFNQIVLLNQTSERLEAQALADRIAGAINTVYLAGEGANYTLMPNLGDFDMRIYPSVVEVRGSKGQIFASQLLVSELDPSYLAVDSDPLIITHKGDEIELEN